MYRIILQAGGNCRANATIPAASLDVSADLKDEGLSCRPIDLVGPEFMEEVRASNWKLLRPQACHALKLKQRSGFAAGATAPKCTWLLF